MTDIKLKDGRTLPIPVWIRELVKDEVKLQLRELKKIERAENVRRKSSGTEGETEELG